MKQPAITVIVNNNTYNLSTSNVEAIRRIPAADRQQLIALLELVKQQETVAQSPISQTTTGTTSTVYNTCAPISPQARRTERPGSGDIDALAAQLMMEEKAKQKPVVTKGTIYKWVGGIAIAIILLVLML